MTGVQTCALPIFNILDGKDVTDGLDLGIEGYDNLALDGKVLYGQAWIDVNKDNVDDPAYDF